MLLRRLLRVSLKSWKERRKGEDFPPWPQLLSRACNTSDLDRAPLGCVCVWELNCLDARGVAGGASALDRGAMWELRIQPTPRTGPAGRLPV